MNLFEEVFTERVQARLFKDDYKEVEEIVANNPDTYENISHYVRVAVIKLNRSYR